MLENMKVEHVVDPNTIDLQQITSESWADIVSLCPDLPHNPRINIFFDSFLENTTILAYASQSLHLSSEAVWVSTIYEAMTQNRNYSTGSSYDMSIGFNPNPPNGWHIDRDCDSISGKYDIRTVLKHELLHGLILAGSLREDTDEFGINYWKAGYNFNGICYPRLYDTLVKDVEDNYVLGLGCVMNPLLLSLNSKDLYIGDVKLYHPYYFQSGSSISHHNYPGNLMYYSLPPMTCMDLGAYEGKLLSKLGVECTIGNKTYKKSEATKNLYRRLSVVITILILILLF